MPICDTVKSYKQKFFNKYPSSILKIIGFLKNKVLIKNEFGYLLKNKKDLLMNPNISIESAIFKNLYFANKCNKIHNHRFNYDKIEYFGNKCLLNIECKRHGIFKQRAINHLCGSICPKCQKENHSINLTWSYKDFIKRANQVHNFKYNYKNTIFINTRTKLKILCELHGEFIQRPSDHLSGAGCRKCGNLVLSNFHKNKSNAWIYGNWYKAALRSKIFDSFKVYVIKCWNKDEIFYKVGKTYNTINRRFIQSKYMPYKYEILKVFENVELTEQSSREISEKEQQLKNYNKEHKYIPKIKFGGMYECFSEIKY